MAVKLKADDFLNRIAQGGMILLDARSESEYAHAHIPGALNFPLLRDEERKIVGTIYKQQGREAAVSKGFELVGPRFHTMIADASARFKGKDLLIYCWRGGMRSQITAWVLGLAGFRVTLLEGGYKAFRNRILEELSSARQILVLGGQTGSGKTEVLQAMKQSGEQVIDLEGIARHKGSAFGGIGQPSQPSNEQFENLLGLEWLRSDPKKTLWLENESRHIGTCMLPESIYRQIREAQLIELVIPVAHRKIRITEDYGRFPSEQLAAATERIGKRLGPQHLKSALEDLYSGNFEGWLNTVLAYYDKLYAYGTSQRDQGRITRFETELQDPAHVAGALLKTINNNITSK